MKCMANDCGINLAVLKVDGGMTINNLFLQMQSDLLATKVCKLLYLYDHYFKIVYNILNTNDTVLKCTERRHTEAFYAAP